MDELREFEAFQRVLVRDKSSEVWNANLFAYRDADSAKPYVCIGGERHAQCIAYNERTKDLLGVSGGPGTPAPTPRFGDRVFAWTRDRSSGRTGVFLEFCEGMKAPYRVAVSGCETMFFEYCEHFEW